MELQARIGQRIRRRREELGMTQQELAGRELTRGFISQLEKGIVMPSLKSLELIASRLYKPVAYFLEESPGSWTPDGQLAATLERALVRLMERDVGAARELLGRVEEAVRTEPQGPDEHLRIRLEAVRELVALEAQPGEEGLRRAEAALRPIRTAGASRFAALAQAVYGVCLARSGRWAEAAGPLEEARRVLADAPADDAALARQVETCLAIAYAQSGRTDQARPMLEGLWERFVAENRFIMPGEVLLALARCYRAASEPALARQALERAVGLGRLLGLPLLEAAALEQQAAALQEQGDGPLAAGALTRAIEIYRKAEQGHQASRLEVELVRLLWQQGQAEAALERAREALPRVPQPGERARLLLLHGQILARLGRSQEAREVLEQAARVAQEAGLRREFAAACSEVGRILRDQGQHDRASDYLARAVEIYERTLY